MYSFFHHMSYALFTDDEELYQLYQEVEESFCAYNLVVP